MPKKRRVDENDIYLLKTVEWNADLTDEVFVVKVFIQDFKLNHGNIRNSNVKHHLVIPLDQKKKRPSR